MSELTTTSAAGHGRTGPRPLSSMPSSLRVGIISNVRMLATDVDGTLTSGGKLTGQVITTVEALAAARIEVVPVSGRPAGEVQGLCRYLPGVKRALAENGMLEVVPDGPLRWLAAPSDRAWLKSIGETLNREHDAGLSLTPDDFCRVGDVAYERDGRNDAELARLRSIVEAMGAYLVWSNVHVHIAQSIPDKGRGVLFVAGERGLTGEAVATIGDAPNDAGLFMSGRFGLTVGTSDVIPQLEFFPNAPEWVTGASESSGFLELAALLLSVQRNGSVVPF